MNSYELSITLDISFSPYMHIYLENIIQQIKKKRILKLKGK
jgi:hypothetical protein